VGSHREHLLQEYSLLPEFIDGLTSLIEESEDYTCLTLKMLMGKRDKGSKAPLAFAAPATGAKTSGEACSDGNGVA